MKNSHQIPLISFILGFISLFAAGSVSAVQLTVNLTGSVTGWDGDLGTQFSLGDPLNMQYRYDSNAIDEFPAISGEGKYAFSDFSGTLGTYAFDFADGHYSIHPNSSSFGDQLFAYGLGNVLSGDDIAGAKLVLGTAYFRDFDALFLSDDSLITIAPDLSVMEQTGFYLGFDTVDDDRVLVRASIQSAKS